MSLSNLFQRLAQFPPLSEELECRSQPICLLAMSESGLAHS